MSKWTGSISSRGVVLAMRSRRGKERRWNRIARWIPFLGLLG